MKNDTSVLEESSKLLPISHYNFFFLRKEHQWTEKKNPVSMFQMPDCNSNLFHLGIVVLFFFLIICIKLGNYANIMNIDLDVAQKYGLNGKAAQMFY